MNGLISVGIEPFGRCVHRMKSITTVVHLQYHARGRSSIHFGGANPVANAKGLPMHKHFPYHLAIRIPTAIGELLVAATADHIVGVIWADNAASSLSSDPPTPLLGEAIHQLQAYGRGDRHAFDLPVLPQGSPFEKAVWAQMQRIPYGETRTYGEVADMLTSSPRAVGRACGANPIPVIIPCHRIMGRNGKLTGFSGGRGVATKAELLALERRNATCSTSDLPLFATLSR